MSQENTSMTRRTFLAFVQKFLGAVGLAAIVVPVVSYFWPSELEETPTDPIAIGPQGSIPLGQAEVVRYGRYPALVINTDAGIRAYSAVCTHFACICKYDPEINRIVCPCHDGFFDPLDGSVISGPPPRPLDAIPHFVEDGTLFIGGEA